ncbi:MAG TPA: DUF481 domain-containing protein [Enhygromyxa sp.]|nr:DUF481 domain-containing protein [Enhygromyxa sp.]
MGSAPLRIAAWSIVAAACVCGRASVAEASGLNVERVRMNPDQNGVHGGFSVGVDFQAGNSNRLDVSTSAGLAYRQRRHVLFLVGSSKFSTRTRASAGEGLSTLLEPSSRFVNKANLHLRYNYEFLPWLVGEAFTQVERDEFLLLEGRVLFGLGPRFVPFNDGRFSLSLGSHWMLEYEALDPAQVVRPLPARTLVHRSSSYLSLIYATDRLRMSSTTYLQPRFDLFRDLRLLSEANLDVTLIEPVSIRLSLRLRWDTMPSVYCATAVGIAGCAPNDQIPLREVDLAIENAINVRF